METGKEPEKPARDRKRGKWIRPKKYKIADEATLSRILNPPPRPEPEFKGNDYIKGVKNECKFIFMCNEPNCGAKFTTAIGLTLHGNKHLNKNIRCTFCNMLFKNQDDMNKHIDEFHPDLVKNPDANPLQCKKCGRCSRDKMALWRHVRESHRDRNWPCPQCNFPFTRPENLKEHLKTQHPPKGQQGPEKISCKTCGKQFAHSRALRTHIRQQHRGKSDTYRCVLCNTIYNCRTTYRNHMKRHINPKYIQCYVCNVKFTSGNHMRRHRSSASHRKRVAQSEAKKKDIFPVPIIKTVKTAVNPNLTKEELVALCKKTVVKIFLHRVDQHIMHQSIAKIEKRKPELLQNAASSQTNGTAKMTSDLERESSKSPDIFKEVEGDGDDERANHNLNCMYCDKAFPTVQAVNSHEFACYLKIRNKKISICPVCNKEFDKPYKLKVHSGKHLNERPYPCSYCDSFFKTYNGKIQHEKSSHFGIRQTNYAGRVFNCSYEGCSRQYSRPEGLRRHIKTEHLGIRYTCKICFRSYARPRSYKEHLKIDHADCPIRLQCKPCNRTYKTRSTYLAHTKRSRHLRKTREYQQRENKKRGTRMRNSGTSAARSKKSSANTVV